MKIGVAQIETLTGDFNYNFNIHEKCVRLAHDIGVDSLIFPELSITNYNSLRAKELAFDLDDSRFSIIQSWSDQMSISISLGAPIRTDAGVWISSVIFQPGQDKKMISKEHLHGDEIEFFLPAVNEKRTFGSENKVGVVICYEISIPHHLSTVMSEGPEVMVASVAKYENSIEKSYQILSGFSRENEVWTMMSNSVGDADGKPCAGQSAIWDRKGNLLLSLDDKSDGLLTLNTKTGEAQSHLLK